MDELENENEINNNENEFEKTYSQESDYSNESDYSDESDNNQIYLNKKKTNKNYLNNVNQFKNKQAAGGFGNNFMNIKSNNFNKNRFNHNIINYNLPIQRNKEEELNTIYFKNEKERKDGIKLFRICIRNNFQGLTYLFISKKYPLMQSVEDSFYEQKFNLSMKLLNQSPNNNIYNHKNFYGQNLFHILGKISDNSDKKNLCFF